MAFIPDFPTLKKIVKLSNQTDIDNILAREEDVRSNFLGILLGEALISEIETFENDSIPARVRSFILTQRIIGKMLLHGFVPEAELTISDAGVQRSESEYSKTAYAAQVSRLQLNLENESYILLDALIELILANTSNFSTYATAPFYLSGQDLLFQKSADFNNCIRIHRPAFTFYSLTPIIRNTQMLFFDTRYPTAAITVIKNGSSANAILLRTKMRIALANLTMAEACRQGLVVLGASGVRFIGSDNTESMNNEIQGDLQAVATQIKNYKEFGDKVLLICDKLFQDNPSDFGVTSSTDSTTPSNFFA